MRHLKCFLFIAVIAIADEPKKKEYKLNRPLDEVVKWEQGNFSNLNPIIDKNV